MLVCVRRLAWLVGWFVGWLAGWVGLGRVGLAPE